MTGCTAWCALPRRHERWGCPPCSAPRSPSPRCTGMPLARRSTPSARCTWPPTASGTSPIRTGSTCWYSPTDRRATAGWRVRSASATWRGRRVRRSSRCPISPTSPGVRTPGTGGCSPGAARAPCRLRCSPMVRRLPRASCSGWSTCSDATGWWSSCGTTAIRSTRRATMRSPSWRLGPTWRASPRTTSITRSRPSASSLRRSRRCAPAAASTTSIRGCRLPPARICAAVPNRPAASCATPAWSSSQHRSVERRHSTCRWWRRSCHRSRVPTDPMVARSPRCSTCGTSWPRVLGAATANGRHRARTCRCGLGRGAPSITNCR